MSYSVLLRDISHITSDSGFLFNNCSIFARYLFNTYNSLSSIAFFVLKSCGSIGSFVNLLILLAVLYFLMCSNEKFAANTLALPLTNIMFL